jgi:type I restriction enzyme M protein
LGTPPQGRADYAFFQHILASMNDENGRCAILFPHGVLGREEEKDIRAKLVETDLVECIIGIGRNLFYNSPMEACVVVCRKNKTADRKNKVLFIDAKDKVTRKNAESFLELAHIKEIVKAYNSYTYIPGFASKVDVSEIKQNNSSLTIQMYVSSATKESYDLKKNLDEFYDTLEPMHKEFETLKNLLGL